MLKGVLRISMSLSLAQWEKILPKEAHADLARQYNKKINGNKTSLPIAFNEPNTSNESLGKKKTARFNTRFTVKIHSIRNRLIDIDNLFSKYAIDGLRYSEILVDDSPDHLVKIEHTQEKGEVEQTIITIEEL